MPGQQHFSPFESELVLSCMSALSTLKLDDPAALAVFDQLAASGQPLSYPELLAKHDSRQIARILGLVLGGYFMNWSEGGADALVTLHDHLQYFQPEDPELEFQTLWRTVEFARLAAACGTPDTTHPSHEQCLTLSQAAADLARFLAEHPHWRAAAELAAFALTLSKRAGVENDVVLKRLALRMMRKQPKQIFVPLVAQAKFPPPRARGIPSEVLPKLILFAIKQIFVVGVHKPEPGAAISSVEDFNAVVQRMVDDRDFVSFLDCGYQQADETVQSVRVEIRFAQALLNRIREQLDLAPGTEVTPYNFLIDLIAQLITNEAALERWQDEYLFEWFALRGAAPYREQSFFRECVMFVTGTNNFVTATLGETESDIDHWLRYGFFASEQRRMLHLAKSAMV